MFFALLFLTSAVVFAISTVSGGGAGLVLVPILGLGMSATHIPVALSVGSGMSSAARLRFFFHHVDWRLVRWFVPLSLPGAYVGVSLLQWMSPAYVEVVLGLFLLCNLPLLFRRQRSTPIEAGGAPKMMLIGFLAGTLSGLTGAVGLLFNGFYQRLGLRKEQVVATRAANEILLHGAKLMLYAAAGLVNARAIEAGAIVGAAAIVAAMAVRRVLPLLSEALFRRLGYMAMVCAGAFMTLNATMALAAMHDIRWEASRVARGVDVSFSGFGRWAGLELRRDELPEVEFRIPFDALPPMQKTEAMALVEGSERVIVETVWTIKARAYELYVHRNGGVIKYHLQ